MPLPDKKTLPPRLGAALKRLRKSRGLTENQLAVRMGKKSSAGTQISRWERGQATPGADQLWLYLLALDLSFADLDRELEPSPPTSRRLQEIARELDSLARTKES